MLKKKMKITNLIRRIIQVVFFFTLPALYTSAFSGVKYVFRQMGAGAVIENNSFLVTLIWLCVFTICFGRIFCGFACAFGTLGDAVYGLSVFLCKKMKRKPFHIPPAVSKMSYWHFLRWCVFWERTISLQRKVRGKYFPLSMRDILISRHTYRESLFLPESWWECSFRRDSSASIYARWEQYFPCCQCCRYSLIREAEAVVSGAAVPAVRNVRWI